MSTVLEIVKIVVGKRFLVLGFSFHMATCEAKPKATMLGQGDVQ